RAHPNALRCSNRAIRGPNYTHDSVSFRGFVVSSPSEQAEHRRGRRGIARDRVRARSAPFSRPASWSRERLARRSAGDRSWFSSGEATGIAFSLMTFFWRSKRKSLAVLYREVRISRERRKREAMGQPPTNKDYYID